MYLTISIGFKLAPTRTGLPGLTNPSPHPSPHHARPPSGTKPSAQGGSGPHLITQDRARACWPQRQSCGHTSDDSEASRPRKPGKHPPTDPRETDRAAPGRTGAQTHCPHLAPSDPQGPGPGSSVPVRNGFPRRPLPGGPGSQGSGAQLPHASGSTPFPEINLHVLGCKPVHS